MVWITCGPAVASRSSIELGHTWADNCPRSREPSPGRAGRIEGT
jgi:hypothetical protein